MDNQTSLLTGRIGMKEISISKLRRRRRGLISRIQSMELSVIRGSLIERYKRCGKPGCKCAESRGHGPKFYLSVSKPKQRPVMVYVPQDDVEQVGEYLSNFQKVRELLEELCEINLELLKRRKLF